MRAHLRVVAAMACALTTAGTAIADEEDGQPCATSSECAPLKCIHERCRDPSSVIDVHRPALGWSVMFGDGRGYQLAILVADVAAACVVPALMAVAFGGGNGTLNSVFLFAAMVPTTLTGPIVHVAHRRAGPAIISFFGWLSLVPTTIGMDAVGQGFAGSAASTKQQEASGLLAFSIAAAAGTALMTSLDVFMARSVRLSGAPISPAITPLASGALLTLRGAW